jgi:DNA polymerase-3 subunit delta
VPPVPLPYETLVEAIRRGRVAPCYLLSGPDRLQQREVLAALEARVPEIGRTVLDGQACSAADPVGCLRVAGFVPGRLVVVDEPAWLLPARGGAAEEGDGEAPAPAAERGRGRRRERAGPEQVLLDYLAAPSPTAVLVLRTASEPDRRRRLTRAVLEHGVHLEATPPRDNGPWLRARAASLGLELGPKAFATVAARLAGATCERMASELEKLRDHGGPFDAPTLDRLLPPEAAERVFDLVDAAVAGQAGEALRLAAALLGQDEPVPRLLHVLGGQVRNIGAVGEACRGGKRPEAAAPALGLHPFVARKAFDQWRRLGPAAAAAAAEAVWEADLALKSGRLPESAALDLAVLGVVRAFGAGPRSGGGEPLRR